MSRNDDTMVTMELVINTSENFCISIVSSGFCTELGVKMDSSLLLHASNEKFSYLMSKDLRCSKKVCRTISGPYKTSALPESLWC